MKEEVRRIMNLVKEGKLSPEDAAELIDAFTSDGTRETPPPPPPPSDEVGDEAKPKEGKEPFKSFVDFVEGIGKDVSQSVDWKDVAKHVRTAAERGIEGIKAGVDQLKQGKVNFGWFSSQETKDLAMPLNLPDGRVLKVENPCGNIKISGGHETASVSARAFLRGSDPDEARAKAEAYTLIIEESDHSVVIRQPDASGLSVDLVIQVTNQPSIEASTSAGEIRVLDTKNACRATSQSGDIHMRGLNGTLYVSAQNGDLHLEDCAGPTVALETKHGDVSLLNVNGNVNARTAGGDIRSHRGAGKSWSVESVSGDVSLEFQECLNGVVNIRTVNGSAELLVPDGCDARVSLSTLRGTVTCDVPLQDEAKMEQRITGKLGDGSGTIDVSGVNGNIAMGFRNSQA